jgi:para-aminobenzoate synthetase/4-amino-4-deoxychorismate lyase
MVPRACSALFRTPEPGWLQLAGAVETVVAREASDLPRCLAVAEDAARRGFYVAGFVTYEAAAAFGLAVQPPTEDALPLAFFAVFPPSCVSRLDTLPDADHPSALTWTASLDAPSYHQALDRIHRAIADGDTYQLNFTFRLRSKIDRDPAEVFVALDAAQRGEWSAFFDLGTHAICSASPELFFRIDNGLIQCRPMKGTIRRGLWHTADIEQGSRLRTSTKNRAENVMIVDLVRNDLGRIARTGSVEVTSLFDVARYPAQWQMTSTIRADVQGVALADVFAALFPSGSVTGAPKTRSMEIIRELEASPRGLYTGAIGLIEPSGRVQFNVAIRTVVIDRTHQVAEFGVGSGIVWESDSGDEFEECRIKAAIVTSVPPRFDLLETLRWDPATGYCLLQRHLDRIVQSAEFFCRTCARDTLLRTLHSAVRDWVVPAKVRLLVDAGGRARCEVTPAPVTLGAWRVALAASPVSQEDVFLYHKTTHRVAHERARASRPDVDAVLLWNERGEVTESTDANVVIERSNRHITPSAECGLLQGTMRAELLERGHIEEGIVTIEDLHHSTRIWLINSVRGWMDAELV